MLYYSIVSFNLSDKFGCFACFFQCCIDFIFMYIEFYVYLCVSNAYKFSFRKILFFRAEQVRIFPTFYVVTLTKVSCQNKYLFLSIKNLIL